MNQAKITVALVDQVLEKVARPTTTPSRIIWTLPAIGRRIGVGADFVRDNLAKKDGSPVKEIGGRYYAFEDDLISFLRRGQP